MDWVGFDTTMIVNDWVALNGGTPLSLTRMVIGLVVLASDGCVSHVKMPLDELTLALAGAPGSRLNASVLAGTSESDAELVNVTAMPAWTVRSEIAVSIGAAFTSTTVTV